MHPEQPQADHPKEYHELPVANLMPRRKQSPLLKVIIVLLVLIIAGVIVFITTHHNSKKTPAKTPSSQTSTQTSQSASVTHITTATKHYESTDLYLGFDYPSDWSVSDPGSGKLTAVSPMLELRSANNQAVKARIVLTIQNAQTSISQFAGNTAVAPIESQKLTYKSPTPNQRAHTYLTAINYGGGSSTIDAFYITSDNGYTAGQYVPGSDMVKIDPLVSISFFACANTTCSNYGKPTSIAANTWADTNLSKPLITMLQSLAID